MGTGDRRLIARASRGDVEAFERLVQEHSGLVHRVAIKAPGKEAQDASQEVWIRVWRNIQGFRGESAFSTWLYRIAMNTCLNIRGREFRREGREAGEEAALVLRHMKGLSYAEIAEILGVLDGTGKGWVSRGRAAMLVAMTQG